MAGRAISQTISLEGVQEIERQLRSLGTVGEAALKKLQTDTGTVRGLGDLDTKLNGVVSSAERFGQSFGKLISSLGIAGSAFGNLSQRAGTASQTLLTHESHISRVVGKYSLLVGAAVGLGAALFAIGKSSGTAAADISKSADKAGVSVEAYEKLKFVLEGLGLTGNEAEQAIKHFADGTSAASEKAVEAFKKLGIVFAPGEAGAKAAAETMQQYLKVVGNAFPTLDRATKALAGLAVELDPLTGKLRINEQSLIKFTDGLNKLHDPTGKVSDAAVRASAVFDAFGKELGTRLLPFLTQGSSGIKDLLGNFERLNLGVSKSDIELGQKFNRSLSVLEAVAGRAKIAIGSVFTPLAIGVLDTLTSAIASNREALVGWATFLEGGARAAISDFFTILRGEQGPLQTPWIESLRNGLTSLSSFISGTVVSAFDSLMKVLDNVAGAINKLFGANIKGSDLGAALLIGQFTGLNQIVLGVIITVTNLGILLGGLALLFPGTALAIAAGIAVAGIVAAFNTLPGSIGEKLTGLEQVLTGPFTAWLGSVTTIVQQIIALIQSVADKAASFQPLFPTGNGPQSTGAAGESNPFASGGYVRGRGTGTSDSIFARLSNGEFVVRAAAVERYGVGFLSRLNSMQLPKFNMGGLVNTFDNLASSLAIPRFASGGLAVAGGGSMSNVTIQFPGLPDIVGLRGSSSVVDDLRKAASMAQIRSGGRKPSRFG